MRFVNKKKIFQKKIIQMQNTVDFIGIRVNVKYQINQFTSLFLLED